MIAALFDGILSLLIIWLAWRAVNGRDLFRATVSFIAFGLVLALTWFRLAAPDLALAEAAVGSGLTGALLLVALRRWREGGSRSSDRPREHGN
jgi:uncharacterized MnhB-related membrane protein